MRQPLSIFVRSLAILATGAVLIACQSTGGNVDLAGGTDGDDLAVQREDHAVDDGIADHRQDLRRSERISGAGDGLGTPYRDLVVLRLAAEVDVHGQGVLAHSAGGKDPDRASEFAPSETVGV